nr:non-lysosomal glucosylceramidase [Tanacetum cinerariifolium]
YNTNNGHNGITENGFSCEDDNSATTSIEDETEEDDKIRCSNPNDDGDDVSSFPYLEEYNTNNGHNGIAENGFSCEDDNSATTSIEDETEEDEKIRCSNPNDDGDDVSSFLYLEGLEYII